MIPQSDNLLLNRSSIISENPSLTYRINNNRISGLIDEKQAIIQAVDLILQTERFAHAIYSWDYGSEFANLYELDTVLVKARLQNRVEEALFADNRIISIENFVITQEKGRFIVNFTMNTIFGKTDYKGVV